VEEAQAIEKVVLVKRRPAGLNWFALAWTGMDQLLFSAQVNASLGSRKLQFYSELFDAESDAAK